MLKAPPLKTSGLYILVFQDRPDRGAFNMFDKNSKIIVEHILRPQYYKAQLFYFRTKIVIIGLTLTFYYQ